jgi:hypothetical protein
MRERDERTFIFVHDGMPDHPKIEGLSDKAFRVLWTYMCWCSRNKTDGFIKASVWRKVPKKARTELEAELVHTPGHDCPRCPDILEGYVRIHDYLEWQNSAEYIEERSEKRRGAGIKGNHDRWHRDRGRYDPDCPLCVGQVPPPEPPPPTNGSQERSHLGSQTDRNCDRNATDSDRNAIAKSSQIDPQKSEVRSKTQVVTSRREVTNPRAGNNRAHTRGSQPIASATTGLAQTKHSLTAHRLVENYAVTCKKRPPSQLLTDLAIEVDALLAEDWTPDELTPVIATWGAKGLHPKTLPSVAHQVVNSTPAATTHANATDAFAAQFLAASHQPPELRALPGGA